MQFQYAVGSRRTRPYSTAEATSDAFNANPTAILMLMIFANIGISDHREGEL
jgi:hypothetical protein